MLFERHRLFSVGAVKAMANAAHAPAIFSSNALSGLVRIPHYAEHAGWITELLAAI